MADACEERRESAVAYLQAVLITDVRALVWEYLASTLELVRWQDDAIFPEICAAVRVLVADLPGAAPLIAAFAARFPRLERVIGPFCHEEQLTQWGYVSPIHEWNTLITRGVTFNYIVFLDKYEDEVADEVDEDGRSGEVEVPEAKARNPELRREKNRLFALLLKNKPWNLGSYRMMYLASRNEDRPLLTQALFDNGTLGCTPQSYMFAAKLGIRRLWLPDLIYDKNEFGHAARWSKTNGLTVEEFGVPRFTDRNERWTAEERERIRERYADAVQANPQLPPLVFQ